MHKNLLETYPPKNIEEEKTLLDFIQGRNSDGTPSITKENQWNIFKALYKKAEQNPCNTKILGQILNIIDELDPLNIQEDSLTSAKTIRYMKRRGRRFVNTLAENDIQKYIDICTELILSHNIDSDHYINLYSQSDRSLHFYPEFTKASQKKSLTKTHYSLFENKIMCYLKNRWILGDIVLGNSEHARQHNNGNGSFTYDYWKLRLCDMGIKYPELWKKGEIKESIINPEQSCSWIALEFIYNLCKLQKREMEIKGINPRSLFSLSSPTYGLKKTALDSNIKWLKELDNKGILVDQFFNNPKHEEESSLYFLSLLFILSNHKDRKWLDEKLLPEIIKDKKRLDQFFQFLIVLLGSRYGNLSGYAISNKLKKNIALIEKYGDQLKAKEKYLNPLSYAIVKTDSPKLQEIIFNNIQKADLEEKLSKWSFLLYNGNDKLWKMFKTQLQEELGNDHWRNISLLPTSLFHEIDDIKELGWQIIGKKYKKLSSNFGFKHYFWKQFEIEIKTNGINHVFENLNKVVTINACDYFNDMLSKIHIYQIDSLKDNYLIDLVTHPFTKDIIWKIISNVPRYYLNTAIRFLKFYDDPNIHFDFIKNKTEIIIELLASRWYNGPLVDYLLTQLKDGASNIWSLVLEISLEIKEADYISKNLLDRVPSEEYNATIQRWLANILSLKEFESCNFRKALIKGIQKALFEESKNPETSDLLKDLGLQIVSKAWEEKINIHYFHWILSISEENWDNYKYAFSMQISEEKIDSDLCMEVIALCKDYLCINNRLWANDEFKTLFLNQADERILKCPDIEAEPIIMEWIGNIKGDKLKQEDTLFTIASHKQKNIREKGWEVIHQSNQQIPFILRLAEYGAPEVTKLASKWFRSIPKQGELETEMILALCDSPEKEVRNLGLEIIEERKHLLDYKNENILQCLAEHPDTYVQERVAESIEENPNNPKFAKDFDKVVLRQRNKARKAKESIKRRLSKGLDFDKEVLLELARGSNKKDAEWAIIQLSKLALMDQVDENEFKIL
ncbi:MAG: hypothetical protein ACEPOW_06665 [Bacteroidales bacterium]